MKNYLALGGTVYCIKCIISLLEDYQAGGNLLQDKPPPLILSVEVPTTAEIEDVVLCDCCNDELNITR